MYKRQGLNRLNWLLEGKDIDIVILCLGANDMLRGTNPSLVRQNLNKILEILTEKKITVLFAGMISQEAFGKKYKKEFDKIYPDLAEKFNVSFLRYSCAPKLNCIEIILPASALIRDLSKSLDDEFPPSYSNS